MEARKQRASRGGRTGGNGRSSGLSETAEAKRWIKGLVARLLKGEVARDTATAAFMGINVLARYIELKRKIREQDSSGYTSAQQAHRQDEAAAAVKRNEDRDRAAFEAAYIAAGGTRTGAADAHRQKRDERAAEAAQAADEAARLAQRGATMTRL